MKGDYVFPGSGYGFAAVEVSGVWTAGRLVLVVGSDTLCAGRSLVDVGPMPRATPSARPWKLKEKRMQDRRDRNQKRAGSQLTKNKKR